MRWMLVGVALAGGCLAPPDGLLDPGPPAILTSIATGDQHSCGVAEDGTALCWGNDFSGQLGSRALTDDCPILGPIDMSGGLGVVGYFDCELALVGAAPGRTFRSLAVSRLHAGIYPDRGFTCGLATDGALSCWGIVPGTNDIIGPTATVPDVRFTDVVLGQDHACGLVSDGTVWCWGSNALGQLGGGTVGPAIEPGPVRVIGGIAFVAVAAGNRTTCGIDASGQAWCWGELYQPNGNPADAVPSPTAVTLPAGVVLSKISAAPHHACGLASDGSVYCWHFGLDVESIGGGPFTSIAAGGVELGGDTFTGQIGTTVNPAPVSAGCALDSAGAASCWGSFNISCTDTCTARFEVTTDFGTAPAAVEGGLHFRSLAASFQRVCGVTDAGAGYCLGAPPFGSQDSPSSAAAQRWVAVPAPYAIQ